ncbi:MAG: type II toxin-antitoxin system VapC family toxin [Saprospiraceae bacterium]
MGLLLDTHTLIWYLEGDAQLSSTAKRQLDNQSERRCVSAVSVWEMAIKINLGKLQIKKPLSDLPNFLSVNGFEWINLGFEYSLAYLNLPLHHRDPFDRMLIAQASVEGLTIVTRDPHFVDYGVPLLWE